VLTRRADFSCRYKPFSLLRSLSLLLLLLLLHWL
jgi:hypothetical protein